MDSQQQGTYSTVDQSNQQQQSVQAPSDTSMSDEDRKRIVLSNQVQQGQHFFVIVFKGLFKIIEEISSLLIRR